MEADPQKEIHCPVCGAGCSGSLRATYTVEQAASHFCPAVRDSDRHARFARCIERIWKRTHAEILQCRACGFGFCHPHVAGNAEFYGILHECAGYPAWRWEYSLAAQRAQTAFPRGGKSLDIGAGDGAFLSSLDARWESYGIESTDTTVRMLRDRGINVFRDLDEANEHMAGQCQLITLFQVIEHVAEFRSMFNAVRRLLCPGGLLAVSCPNGDEIPIREYAVRYPDMPPNHVNKWNSTSIAHILHQCGFEDINSERQPASLKCVPYATYLRACHDASERPRSLAAQSYRIRSKVIRAQVLRLVCLFTALKLLPHLPAAKLSVNFITFAHANAAPYQSTQEQAHAQEASGDNPMAHVGRRTSSFVFRHHAALPFQVSGLPAARSSPPQITRRRALPPSPS